eukprot:764671-Rhodomonas_salina.1
MEEMVGRPNDHDSTEPLAPDAVMSTQRPILDPGDAPQWKNFPQCQVAIDLLHSHPENLHGLEDVVVRGLGVVGQLANIERHAFHPLPNEFLIDSEATTSVLVDLMPQERAALPKMRQRHFLQAPTLL